MRISCTASGGGKFMPVVWPKCVKFAPLKVKLLLTERPPLTLMFGPARVLPISCGAITSVIPGRIRASAITLRPLSGRSVHAAIVHQAGERLAGGVHQRRRCWRR